MNPIGGNELIMVFDRIVAAVLPGTTIPKPHATQHVQLKGIGQRRGEDALIYSIPNHNDPSHPYQKGVTRSELEQAYCELRRSKSISRAWFNREMQAAAAEGGCNFTTIGGLFQLIGTARYSSIGKYEWTNQESGGCPESERVSKSHVAAAAAHLSKSWLRGRTPRGR